MVYLHNCCDRFLLVYTLHDWKPMYFRFDMPTNRLEAVYSLVALNTGIPDPLHKSSEVFDPANRARLTRPWKPKANTEHRLRRLLTPCRTPKDLLSAFIWSETPAS
jgi:hypothetical protein